MTQETEHNGVVAVEAADTSFKPTHRHKKRGTLYKVIAIAKMQANWFNRYGDCVDDDDVVVYLGEDGRVWVRPQREFTDGRFEVLLVEEGASQ